MFEIDFSSSFNLDFGMVDYRYLDGHARCVLSVCIFMGCMSKGAQNFKLKAQAWAEV